MQSMIMLATSGLALALSIALLVNDSSASGSLWKVLETVILGASAGCTFFWLRRLNRDWQCRDVESPWSHEGAEGPRPTEWTSARTGEELRGL